MLHLLLSSAYVHGYLSTKLVNCMPAPFRGFTAQVSIYPHTFSVHLTNAIVSQHLNYCIPFTGKLWDSLPNCVFSTFLRL